MPDEKQPQWGGRRPGSGRKPNGDYPHQITTRLTDEQLDHLTSRAAALDISMAAYLRALIDADMASQQP